MTNTEGQGMLEQPVDITILAVECLLCEYLATGPYASEDTYFCRHIHCSL